MRLSAQTPHLSELTVRGTSFEASDQSAVTIGHIIITPPRPPTTLQGLCESNRIPVLTQAKNTSATAIGGEPFPSGLN
jgi:hypothetical protein